SSHFQRKRQEDEMIEDNGDDDISLVSHSPSPTEAMDVDQEDGVSKYDEYVQKPIRETITVDTKIKPSNKGFSLLAKMGWSEGQPLGLSGDGRVDPIPFEIKSDTFGIGRMAQETQMATEAVSARRGLDSERQVQETEEQRRAREDQVARKAAVQDEITSTLRAFYCTLCEKQFQNVAQYDEHTNSYAHHHRARSKDMQANARLKPQEEIDKRREKERKREERELRKIAAAAGIKMPKPNVATTEAAAGPQTGLPSVAPTDTSPSMDIDASTSAQKKGGWASVGSASSASSASGFKKSGWTTVGSSSSTTISTPPPPRSSGSAPASSSTMPSTGGSSSSNAPFSQQHTSHTPSFRTGGWTSLDTGTSITVQPPLGPSPPSQPPSFTASFHTTTTSIASSQSPPPPSADSRPARPMIGGRRGWTSISTPPPSSELELPPVPKPAVVPGASRAPSQPEPAPGPQSTQSGWQKFQAKNTKRR
ncbi:G patch domain-containing protein 8, partial [Leucoagaricus sp. SymC.cos]